MAQRVHYRRHNHYNTKSNKVRPVRTPGGKLTIHVVKKKAGKPKCADCKTAIQGVKALRPADNYRARRKNRTVARAYGSICARCIRERIMRAFLFEEQKCVRQVLKEKKKQEKKVKKVKKEKKKVNAKEVKKTATDNKKAKKVADKKKGK
uniref:60S ribosomal protein L34 n=1 Tax=Plasmodium falciparum (isolate 3D7) TaxID=36329 RepID=UPI003510D2CA